METLLLILYLLVLIFLIVLLVRAVKKPERKRWLALWCGSALAALAAFLLMHWFNSLPGTGQMAGLTWFAETFYSLGAAVAYAAVFAASLVAALLRGK